MGLPIESLYPVDLWRLRRRQARVAELACFASLDGLGTQCVAVLRALLHSAIDLALRRQIEELVICVHPRQAPFYERRLGFQEFGPLRCCPWVCNQPAVAMRLSLMESNQASAAIALGNRGSEFRTTDLELTGLLPSDRAYFRGLLVETSPFARPDARPGRTAVAA
jgi:hypothetical protein